MRLINLSEGNYRFLTRLTPRSSLKDETESPVRWIQRAKESLVMRYDAGVCINGTRVHLVLPAFRSAKRGRSFLIWDT